MNDAIVCRGPMTSTNTKETTDMRKQMSQADKDAANHLTKMINAYQVMIDESEPQEAARLERVQDELREQRNQLIW